MKRLAHFTSRIGTLVLVFGLLFGISLPSFGQAAPPLKEPPLRTNNSSDYLLQRADQYLEEGRSALAAQLWQRVIDESQDTVASEGERQRTLLAEFNIFRPRLPSLERMIAEKPRESLDAYRLRADGEAKALLAKAESPAERNDALIQIANRLFLSNLGDDAVMELSGEALEQFEFVTAERLLKKLVNIHPNPSVDLNQAKLRLAMAAGRNNNLGLATQLLEELRANQTVPASMLDAVEKALPARKIAKEAGPAGWPMAAGSSGRDGLMPALPAGPLSSYKLVWEQPFTLNAPAGLENDLEREEDHFGDDTALLLRWAQRDYRPVTTLRFGGSSVFFQNDERLIGVRARDGRIVKAFPKMGYQDPNMQSLQQNAMRFGRPLPTDPSAPKSLAESQLFKASLEQSMLWQDDVVFVVERPSPLEMPRQAQAQRFGAFLPVTRFRNNRLVAYGANPRKASEEQWAYQPENSGCILGEPTPFRNSVVVPILERNRIELVALDKTTGKQLWRSYLCEEQVGEVAPYAEATLAVSGDDIYALTGNGILGAFEGTTGNLHWVLQHARSVTKKNIRVAGVGVEINGWKKNHLMVSGPNLIVAPSDMEYMFAADRRTGMIRWRQFMYFDDDESTPYPLGIVGDHLYVASNQTLRMQPVKDGRIIKGRPERPLAKKDKDFTRFFESYGRGALTANEILIPHNNEVLRFDHELNLIDRAALNDDDSIPLGNLFSDGKRLYQVGLRSIQAFEPEPEEEEEEAKPTDEKDVTP